MAYLLARTWTGCQTNLKFGMQSNFVVLWKNLKITFWSLFIVKMEFEKYKYFMWFFLRLKYLMCSFQASAQLVPRFYSHLSCSLLQLQLILLQIPNLQLTAFNSYPNIYQKWNWAENNLQIFCLKLLNFKKMGAKEEISLMELFLKDSHIVQCIAHRCFEAFSKPRCLTM